MQSILQKAKNGMNQTLGSGSAVFAVRRLFFREKNSLILALCFGLLLVGSCHEGAGTFDFENKLEDIKKLSKAELVRYGHALQLAIMQAPKNIKKLNADEVRLALSSPDFSRQDGRHDIWQYRTDSCVLDIYWKNESSSKPAAHFEFRQRRSVLDGTQAVIEPVQWQCVQTIVQNNRNKIDSGFSDAYADLSLKAHKP